MPFGEVRLIPGINVERTPTLLEAGYASSQLIRFKDGLAQKYGGWTTYYSSTVAGFPRDMHAWQDLNATDHLLIGTTTQLSVLTGTTLNVITPQTLTSNFTSNFSTLANSTTVGITDPNVTNPTIYDAVLFNTPVSVGSTILSGLYPIEQVTGASSYNINISAPAPATATSTGTVPLFSAASGGATVTVNLTSSNQTSGNTVVFPLPTTIGASGITVSGSYVVSSVTDTSNFVITVANTASTTASAYMNSLQTQLVYFINIGPQGAGAGYGLGVYGGGGYGTGISVVGQTGSPITATDWTSDNWGEIVVANPQGGGVYTFDPTGGFLNAGLVPTAPVFNNGIFVSTSQQILVCYGSTVTEDIGIQQDPMLVRWSDSGDFTNFVPTVIDQAGSFRIPVGSRIVAGMAVQNQNLLWTDLDCWAMNYQGTPFIYGFNRIGSGAGAVSSHAVQPLRGSVFWMGTSNFYTYNNNGVSVLPCPVWDFVFQNINTAYLSNVRAMPNTPFNEAGWLFPSLSSVNGECDSYVKMNITEPNAPWDYGALQRSAWIDQTILGPPISANAGGQIFQQEMTNDANGQPMASSFTTGYFYISEGEDFAFVDQIIPDMIWGTYAAAKGANVQISFNVTNYPGDTPTVYGPYTVMQDTEYISVRFRGRQMSVTLQSSDLNSFWRLGKIRYRFAPAGRR